MAEKTIPLLPCHSPLMTDVVAFYEALGFTTTLRQTSPYAYAVVERGDIELQFFGLKEYDPAASHSGCYVLTDDVDGLHTAFRSGLKAAYGRIPSRGLPRIGPVKNMSYGVRQFLITDPTGNSLRVGQFTGEGSADGSHSPVPKELFERAIHQGVLFADSKEDLPAAARVVDRALARTDRTPTAIQLLRLLVLRGDIARRQGDEAAARELLARAVAVPLDTAERAAVRDDLNRLGELTGRED
ncbi:bleomycin resistance protein [Streptomyces qinzhouensis]|uniref:VOC family protein n=1 Tax=Streptomyces qinzhouensis TaxID=2599401 RepID=A0A5B8JA81_9ACTN|nr:VOC family protein [Streptomyces qinzhouensis]QDY78277.1 VOC family protein [Streptomyces qinzhouensis]